MTPQPLDLLTLHEAASLLGVTYHHLSRVYRRLGIQPAKRAGQSILFWRYAIEEWFLSYRPAFAGRLTLRWLPWTAADFARALGIQPQTIYSSNHPPPYYLAHQRPASRTYIRRYNPPEAADWAKIHGYQLDICNGFPRETRRIWAELLETQDGPG